MALYKVKADANQPEMQKLNDKQQKLLKMAMEMQQNKVEVSLANREYLNFLFKKCPLGNKWGNKLMDLITKVY